jgi:hypothetical protein
VEERVVGGKRDLRWDVALTLSLALFVCGCSRDDLESDYLKSIGVKTYAQVKSKDCGSDIDRCVNLIFTSSHRPSATGLNRIDDLDRDYLLREASDLSGGKIDFSGYDIYRGDYYEKAGVCESGCGVVLMMKSANDPYFVNVTKH